MFRKDRLICSKTTEHSVKPMVLSMGQTELVQPMDIPRSVGRSHTPSLFACGCLRCLANPLQFRHRFFKPSALTQLVSRLFCSVMEVMVFYVLQTGISICATTASGVPACNRIVM